MSSSILFGCKDEKPDKVVTQTEPVGIILKAKDGLLGLDAVVLVEPAVEEMIVASSFAALIHTARNSCKEELASSDGEIFKIEGLSILSKKMIVNNDTTTDNKLISCFKKSLDGVSIDKFADTAHVVSITIRQQRQ